MVATALIILALGISAFVSEAPLARAEGNASEKMENSATKTMNTSELQTLIAKLQNQLRELTGAVDIVSDLKVGMNIEVTDSVRIRNSASREGIFIGLQKPGVKGVVIEGPIRQGGYNWVKVDYESGSDGWNATSWLKSHTSPSRPVREAFEVNVSKLIATVSFTLSNGCGGYVISWGDDTKTERIGSVVGNKCTMAIVNVTQDHTYAKAGTYNVKVERFNGSTVKDESTREIKVSTDSKPSTHTSTSTKQTYTLDDVKSVTKRYVDPSTAIADEEYTLYTIILKSGQMREVKVYGVLYLELLKKRLKIQAFQVT